MDQGRASLPISKAQEIIAHASRKSSQTVLSHKEVSQFMGSLNWASGLIPLGRLHMRPLQQHFHLLGLTNQFTPVSTRPFSPCHPTQAMAGPIFSLLRNPYPAIPGRVHNFHGSLYPALGRPHGGFPDFGYLDLVSLQAPHQHFGASGPPFWPSITGFQYYGATKL